MSVEAQIEFGVNSRVPIFTTDGAVHEPGSTFFVGEEGLADQRLQMMVGEGLLVQMGSPPTVQPLWTGGDEEQRNALEALTVPDLEAKAKDLEITGYSSMNKAGLVDAILEHNAAGEAEGDGA